MSDKPVMEGTHQIGYSASSFGPIACLRHRRHATIILCALEQTQQNAWLEEIRILKNVLQPYNGSICFKYSIPRMGKRIDAVHIIRLVIFVLEFKCP